MAGFQKHRARQTISRQNYSSKDAIQAPENHVQREAAWKTQKSFHVCSVANCLIVRAVHHFNLTHLRLVCYQYAALQNVCLHLFAQIGIRELAFGRDNAGIK